MGAVVGSCPMSTLPFLDTAQALRDRMAASPAPCPCALQRCAGWDSLSDAEWPSDQLQAVASLRDPRIDEPTFAEHHPQGTRYESADAPVALKFFPYNRCEVFACQRCQQTVLRYTEFGGYYVDQRARRIGPASVLDDAQP